MLWHSAYFMFVQNHTYIILEECKLKIATEWSPISGWYTIISASEKITVNMKAVSSSGATAAGDHLPELLSRHSATCYGSGASRKLSLSTCLEWRFSASEALAWRRGCWQSGNRAGTPVINKSSRGVGKGGVPAVGKMVYCYPIFTAYGVKM